MIRLFFVLFILVYFSFFISEIFEIKFGKSIPCAYVAITLLMFISSLIGKLSYFKYVILISVFVMGIIIYFKNKNIKKIFDKFINFVTCPSLLVFGLFFVYSYFLLQDVNFSNTDDLGFWGTKLKDMFRTDSLYTNTDYIVYPTSSGYPPFAHLLEMSFIKLFGCFDETYSIMSTATFTLSFFMVIFDNHKLSFKEMTKILLLSIIVILTTLMIQRNPSMAYDSYIYNSIYVDWILSVVLAYGFYSIYNFNFSCRFDFFNLAMCVFVLLFTKQIGMALALLLVVTALIKLIIFKEFKKNNITNFVLYCIIGPLVLYGTWRSFLSAYITPSLPSYIIESALNIGVSDVYYLDIVKSFVIALFEKDIFIHPFGLNYVELVLIIVAILFLTIGRKKYKENVVTLFYFLGAIGYALGILLSYMYVFGHEGSTLAMFGRYMQTYTYAGIVLVVLILLNKIYDRKKLFIIFILSIFLIEPRSVKTIIYKKDHIGFREKEITKISNYLFGEYDNQKMLVINQTDIGYQNMLKYTAAEKCKYMTFIQLTEDKDQKYFEDKLKENELLLIADFDSRFVSYWEKVTDIAPYNNSLYRIIKTNGKIELELVQTWDGE